MYKFMKSNNNILPHVIFASPSKWFKSHKLLNLSFKHVDDDFTAVIWAVLARESQALQEIC